MTLRGKTGASRQLGAALFSATPGPRKRHWAAYSETGSVIGCAKSPEQLRRFFGADVEVRRA